MAQLKGFALKNIFRRQVILSLMSMLVVLFFFQNCSQQKGLDLLLLKGSGVGVKISSQTPESLDENTELFAVDIDIATDVEKFDTSKIQVDNAIIESIQGAEKHYTLNLIPKAPGIITVFVPENSCKKIKSNTMCASSNLFQRTLISDPPQVKLTPVSNRESVADSFLLNIDLTKPFMLNDSGVFRVANARLENLSLRDGNGCSLCEFQATVVPTGTLGSTISIQLPENIFQNKWKIGNSASNDYQVLFAATPPEILLTSTAPPEVLGTFEVQLVSSIPITNITSITSDSFIITGGEIYGIENFVDKNGKNDPFKALIRIRPNADTITLQARENIISNRWSQGNPIPKDVLTRKYTNSKFTVTHPTPALPITPANVHSYNIKGQCPYNDRTVKVYIDKPTKVSIGETTCVHSTDVTTGIFEFNLDFGNRPVGIYVLNFETTDTSGVPISFVYSVEMASALNISTDTTPNPLIFEEVFSDAANTRVYSNVLFVSGIDSQIGVSFNGVASSLGTPKFKIIRNNQVLGSETSVATIQNGDLISLSASVPPYHGMTYDIEVNIGSLTTHWRVNHVNSESFAVVFSTQETTNPGYYGGSVVKGDEFCQERANSLGFGGTWKAILAEMTSPLPNRVPWAWKTLRRIDGAIVAHSWKDLWKGSQRLLVPMNINQYGEINSGSRAFTAVSDGEGNSGANINQYCGTSESSPYSYYGGSATAGFISATNQSWLFGNSISCWGRASLYCISDTNGSLDETPSPVEFLRSVSYIPNEKITSNEVKITGITKSISVRVEDTNNTARITINGGPEVLSGKVVIGDVVRVTNLAPSTVGQVVSAKIFLGTIDRTWFLGTADSTRKSRIFISSENYGGALGGLAGADQKCTDLAIKAGYGGTWKAMLSDTNNNMRDRIPWNWKTLVSPDNSTIIAESWNNLWSGSLKAGIKQTEYQSIITSSEPIWTGSYANGQRKLKTDSESYCNDWNGTHGFITTVGGTDQMDSKWASKGSDDCYRSYKIYCIENENAGEDETPNTFSIPYKVFQTPNSRLSSDIITITGISVPVNVSLSGIQGGSPTFKIQKSDGSWTGELTSSTIQNGEKIVLLMSAPSTLNSSYKVEIKVGTKTVPWRVWTADSNSGTKKIIFISSETVQGNHGGLYSLDAKCQTLGQIIDAKRSTSSTWKALVSGELESTWAINKIGYNWSELWTVNTDGTYREKVFTGAQIWDGTGPSAPIIYDENGNSPSSWSDPLNTRVWTNTQNTGLATSTTQTCVNFTGGNYTLFGIGSIGGGSQSWVSSGQLACEYHAHLICIQN